MPMDPVCGVQIDEDEAVTGKYHGRTYYFCCDDCKEEFMENPEDYVEEEASQTYGEEF